MMLVGGIILTIPGLTRQNAKHTWALSTLRSDLTRQEFRLSTSTELLVIAALHGLQLAAPTSKPLSPSQTTSWTTFSRRRNITPSSIPTLWLSLAGSNAAIP